MNHGVLLALKRKRESFAAAGLTDKLAAIDERIAAYEAELEDAPEPEVVEVVAEEEAQEEAAVPAGVPLTPAAQQLADELGLTAEDFKDHQPSGKGGFLVSDVQRIAEAKAHIEEDTDGDD